MRNLEGKIIKWVGSCTDIHLQALALAESRRTQAQLSSLLDHARVTLWAIDKEANVTIAQGPGTRALKLSEGSSSTNDGSSSENSRNKGSEASGGAKSHQSLTVGRNVFDVWDRDDIKRTIQKALLGTSTTTEMEMDGRWFNTSYSPLFSTLEAGGINTEGGGGEITGVAGVSVDITDRKRAEFRLRETLEEKSKALSQAETAKEASNLKVSDEDGHQKRDEQKLTETLFPTSSASTSVSVLGEHEP